jgi:hypothetical protein
MQPTTALPRAGHLLDKNAGTGMPDPNEPSESANLCHGVRWSIVLCCNGRRQAYGNYWTLIACRSYVRASGTDRTSLGQLSGISTVERTRKQPGAGKLKPACTDERVSLRCLFELYRCKRVLRSAREILFLPFWPPTTVVVPGKSRLIPAA